MQTKGMEWVANEQSKDSVLSTAITCTITTDTLYNRQAIELVVEEQYAAHSSLGIRVILVEQVIVFVPSDCSIKSLF